MIVPIDWLKEYTNIKSAPEVLADKLTMQTAEVEEIISPPQAVLEAQVVEVISVEPHPNADRLKLVTVGNKNINKKVVCGAPNVKTGQVVPFVKEGNSYIDEEGNLKTLGKAVIRGVESSGMLASERDLGLSESHEGIMVLSRTALGKKNLAVALGMKEPVLKLEITPNRSDLFSVIGLAREIAYFEKTRLNLPNVGTSNQNDTKTLIKPEVTTEKCHRYCVQAVTNLTNGQSPDWLANRLRQAGLRPISAVVDVTNYVMLEYGQPLHAFDYDLLKNRQGIADLTVREAKKNECLAALDGNNYQLETGDIVISNDGQAIALAGVIGGEHAAVNANTKTIILESAVFDPGNTRRTANRLGLRTESLTRFEKGIDPELQIIALKRALSLLAEISGGKPTGKLFDLNFIKHKKPTIAVSLERVKQLVGIDFDKQQAKNALSAIGFTVTSTSQLGLKIIPPSWRTDVEREEDIVEELVRLLGYDKLPNTLPEGPLASSTQQSNEYALTQSIRQLITANGYNDIISQPFMSQQQLELFKLDASSMVEITNPTSRNEQFLRPSIAPLLCIRLASLSVEHESLLSFELGHVFKLESENELSEILHLGSASLTKEPVNEVRRLKSIIEQIGPSCEKSFPITFKTNHQPNNYLQAGWQSIINDGQVIGHIGIVDPTITNQLKIRGSRYLITAEVDLKNLINSPSQIAVAKKKSIYQSSKRDLTVALAANTESAEVIKKATQKVNNLADCQVINYYQDQQKRTVTLRLIIQSESKTLTEGEINETVNMVLKNIEQVKGAELVK